MKVSKRMVLKAVIGLFVVSALSLLLLYLLPYMQLFRLVRMAVEKDQQKRVRLLSETDPHALLEACRELSREVLAGNLAAPNRYIVRPEPVPEVSRFPQLILDLDPMFIETAIDGSIAVGMQGGFHHYGVSAYPQNFEKPSQSFNYGDKKIIDGLWYYEDGYNPKLDKWIEELIQKGKIKQAEISK